MILSPGVRREIRKPVCTHCNGTGYISEEIRIDKCELCNGLGWIEPNIRNEQLCPECHGNGKIETKIKKNCIVCSGKGYLIKILEICIVRLICSQCNGYKFFEKEIECPKCGGLGSVDKPDFEANIFKPEKYLFNGDVQCKKCRGRGVVASRYTQVRKTQQNQ